MPRPSSKNQTRQWPEVVKRKQKQHKGSAGTSTLWRLWRRGKKEIDTRKSQETGEGQERAEGQKRGDGQEAGDGRGTGEGQ